MASGSLPSFTVLTEEDDVPGSKFEREPEEYTVGQLKRWLKCVKWGWQASRLLRFVAFVHLPFSCRSPDLFCRFTVVYEGHSVLCCKEKLEPLDRAIANFKRS